MSCPCATHPAAHVTLRDDHLYREALRRTPGFVDRLRRRRRWITNIPQGDCAEKGVQLLRPDVTGYQRHLRKGKLDKRLPAERVPVGSTPFPPPVDAPAPDCPPLTARRRAVFFSPVTRVPLVGSQLSSATRISIVSAWFHSVHDGRHEQVGQAAIKAHGRDDGHACFLGCDLVALERRLVRSAALPSRRDNESPPATRRAPPRRPYP